jgi:hypothetical protein
MLATQAGDNIRESDSRSFCEIATFSRVPFFCKMQHTDVIPPRATGVLSRRKRNAYVKLVVPILAIDTSIVSTSSNRAALKYSQLAETLGQVRCKPFSNGCITDRPRWRSMSCSADSIIGKNAEKCTIPAASVSRNSIRRWTENIRGQTIRRQRA